MADDKAFVWNVWKLILRCIKCGVIKCHTVFSDIVLHWNMYDQISDGYVGKNDHNDKLTVCYMAYK